MRKAQNWSIDAIIAVMIFVGTFITFYYLTGLSQKEPFATLTAEGEQTSEILQTINESFLEGNMVDELNLEYFSNKSYQELKDKLGIQTDFCIHFEDEAGNIIFLDDKNKTGIGDPSFVLGGRNCS